LVKGLSGHALALMGIPFSIGLQITIIRLRQQTSHLTGSFSWSY